MALKDLKPWKPGQSGNPSGKPRVPDHLRGIHSLTQLEACKLISKFARLNAAELMTLMENPAGLTVLEAAIASIFHKCIQQGDFARLSFLLDRAIGRIPTITESDDEKVAREELQSLTDQELIRIVSEKIPELTAKKAE